jgi:hypothetical protein
MREDPLESLIGIKLTIAVAGFLGGVIQLSFNRTLSVWGAMLSVLAGVCSAAFGTPLLSWYYTLPTSLENGIAFLMGLLGMLLTGKIYQFVSSMTVERVLGLFKKGGPNE